MQDLPWGGGRTKEEPGGGEDVGQENLHKEAASRTEDEHCGGKEERKGGTQRPALETGNTTNNCSVRKHPYNI